MMAQSPQSSLYRPQMSPMNMMSKRSSFKCQQEKLFQ
jgi:hypothetical protein